MYTQNGIPPRRFALVASFAVVVLASIIYNTAQSSGRRRHHLYYSLNRSQVQEEFYVALKRSLQNGDTTDPNVLEIRQIARSTATNHNATAEEKRSGSHERKMHNDTVIRERLPSCSLESNTVHHFIMVFMGHSASSAILSELSQHSGMHITVPEPLDHAPFQFNSQLGLQYADEFFTNATRYGKIGGFKMRPWHILHSPEQWRAMIKKHNVRVLWQYRENIFKQAVGEYTSIYLNDSSAIEGVQHWVSEEERCKIGAGCKFRVEDVASLHKLMVQQLQNDEQIRNAVYLLTHAAEEEACVLPYPYEDYLYDRIGSMRKLSMFLGVALEDHLPFRRKATSDNMCNAVVNFQQEICQAFFGCPQWRGYLKDRVNNCSCHRLTGSMLSDSNVFCSTHI